MMRAASRTAQRMRPPRPENGASQGKILGFFAPSNAAKVTMDAAGGHVKLVILPHAAPDGTQAPLSASADQSVSARKARCG